MARGEAPPLLLRGLRLIDSRGVLSERADVLIEGERIARISPDPLAVESAEVIDLSGWTCVPGLMNAHTHVCLDGSADPAAVLRAENDVETAIRAAHRLEGVVAAGVTTIRDLGGPGGIDIALRSMIERGEIVGPRMLTAGRVVTMTGGHGHWIGIEADGPDSVRQAVRTQIRAGATTIKVIATGGMMTPNQVAGAPQLTVDEMTAAVDEAHKAGLIVAAHAESALGAKNAILGGVDSIEHGHGIDADGIQLMLDRGTALVPTILSDRAIIEGGVAAGIPDFVVEKCVALAPSLVTTLEAAIQAGVTIVAGNDGGAPLVGSDDIVSELELYVRHGMTPLGALQSATAAAARLLRLFDVGLLEPGYAADLLVVDEDPLRDLAALRRPVLVVARGQLVANNRAGRRI